MKKQKKNKGKKILYKYAELFCGPGGLGLGASMAEAEKDGSLYSIKHEWVSDYHSDSCNTYRLNIMKDNPENVIYGDVRKLNIKQLSPIDIFAYGFPCNDFSIVGKQKGFQGDFGPLYTYGVKVINYFKPAAFIAENVGGIKSANDGKAFRKILHDLETAGRGYNITVNYYKFEEYGIPQTRHRVIIAGVAKDIGRYFAVPAPTHKNKPVTVREVLENKPIGPDIKNNELKNQSEAVVERLKYIKPGENSWTAEIPKRLQLDVKSAKLSQIYKRLHPDKPSYTLTGSGGGGTHGYHWKYNRGLTNRERARIQTFPDDFVFCGSSESVRKQIGMAVSPLMSKIVFEALLKTLAGVSYKSVEPNIVYEQRLFEEELELISA